MKTMKPYVVVVLAFCLVWYLVKLDYQEDLRALFVALGVSLLYLFADRKNAAGKIQSMFTGKRYPVRGLVFCVVTTLPLILQLYRKLQYPHIREQRTGHCMC